MPQTATGYEIDKREGPEMLFVSDSQAIAAIMDSVTDTQLDGVNVTREEITALLVAVGDGEYKELWAAESRRPYALDVLYTRIV